MNTLYVVIGPEIKDLSLVCTKWATFFFQGEGKVVDGNMEENRYLYSDRYFYHYPTSLVPSLFHVSCRTFIMYMCIVQYIYSFCFGIIHLKITYVILTYMYTTMLWYLYKKFCSHFILFHVVEIKVSTKVLV